MNNWLNLHQFKPTISLIKILILFSLILIFAAALLPPLGYDAHEYHLAVPETFLLQHQWIQFEWNIYAAFPMNVELLYLWPLAMNSVTGCTVINLLFAALAALALVALSKQKTEQSYSLLSALVFLSTGIVIHLVLQANIDLALSACAAILLLAYERYRNSAESIDLILIALTIGFALGSKYIAILSILFPFTVMWIIDGLLNGTLYKSRNIFFALVVAGLLFAPWVMRNWVLYANPFYPLLTDWFGGQPAFFDELFAAAHSPQQSSLQQQFIDFIALPFNKSIGNQALPFGFSAAWIIALPLVLFTRKHNFVFRLFLFVCSTYGIWFFLTQRNDRFLASILPVLSIFPALLIQHLHSLSLKRLTYGCVLIFVVVSLWAAGSMLFQADRIDYLFTPSFEESYFVENMPHYRAIEWLNQRQQEGRQVGTVLFVGEAQTFGAEFVHIAPTVFNYHPVMNPEWQENLPPSITHVLYNGFELDRLSKGYTPLGWPQGEMLQAWINENKGQNLIKVFDAYPDIPDRVVVYQVQR